MVWNARFIGYRNRGLLEVQGDEVQDVLRRGAMVHRVVRWRLRQSGNVTSYSLFHLSPTLPHSPSPSLEGADRYAIAL